MESEAYCTLRDVQKLRGGDHFCGLFRSEEERLSTLADFVENGLKTNCKVVLVQQDLSELKTHTTEQTSKEIDKALTKGQLMQINPKDHCQEGPFSLERMMVENGLKMEQMALEEGYRLLFLSGEPTWSIGPTAENIYQFVRYLNNRLHYKPAHLLHVLSFCQSWESLFSVSHTWELLHGAHVPVYPLQMAQLTPSQSAHQSSPGPHRQSSLPQLLLRPIGRILRPGHCQCRTQQMDLQLKGHSSIPCIVFYSTNAAAQWAKRWGGVHCSSFRALLVPSIIHFPII